MASLGQLIPSCPSQARRSGGTFQVSTSSSLPSKRAFFSAKRKALSNLRNRIWGQVGVMVREAKGLMEADITTPWGAGPLDQLTSSDAPGDMESHMLGSQSDMVLGFACPFCRVQMGTTKIADRSTGGIHIGQHQRCLHVPTLFSPS